MAKKKVLNSRPAEVVAEPVAVEPEKPALVAVKSVDGHPFWERNAAQPGGEVWVAGEALVKVARTAAVERALTDGRLALVE